MGTFTFLLKYIFSEKQREPFYIYLNYKSHMQYIA